MSIVAAIVTLTATRGVPQTVAVFCKKCAVHWLTRVNDDGGADQNQANDGSDVANDDDHDSVSVAQRNTVNSAYSEDLFSSNTAPKF